VQLKISIPSRLLNRNTGSAQSSTFGPADQNIENNPMQSSVAIGMLDSANPNRT
jgi:hypothetical protein